MATIFAEQFFEAIEASTSFNESIDVNLGANEVSDSSLVVIQRRNHEEVHER